MMGGHRVIARTVAAMAGTAALCLGAAVAPAAAHVHVSSPGVVRGSIAILTFDVPNESETGSATTELTVTLPNVASARTETMPGWTATLDRDAAAGIVRSVTWTATPGGGIGADQFGRFQISVKLPDTDEVSFPATQKYADGTVVRWDQPPLPGGAEPDRPAPVLRLAQGAGTSPVTPADQAAPRAQPDNTARWLAGTALLVAAAGVALAMTRRRA